MSRIISCIVVSFMALVMIPLAVFSNTASADEVPVPGPADITLTLPAITVTDIITLEPSTVTVPVTVPTVSVPPIKVPQVVKTVRVPGPTKTVTRRATEFVTHTQGLGPRATVTKKVTVVKTRQPDTTGGTIEPDEDDGIIPGKQTKTEIVYMTILSLLLAIGLALLCLWGGYYLGYKDGAKREAKFLRALRDQIRRNKRE